MLAKQEGKMAKRHKKQEDSISVISRALRNDSELTLQVLRFIARYIMERCDDPVRLQAMYQFLSGRRFPYGYDKKFAEAVRKTEARDALRKKMQLISGGKTDEPSQ
jgi:hypothetical protein